jgi:CBS domain-containing protein
MDIAEIMTSEVYKCSPADSLNAAARVMWENDCGCVPVVDSGGRAIGMITDRDVCMAAYTTGRLLAAVSVAEAMSRHVFTCVAADSVDTVQAIMRAHQIHRVPVVDDAGCVVGIVSLNDLARAATLPGRGKKKAVTAGQLTETVAAICAHTVPRANVAAA